MLTFDRLCRMLGRHRTIWPEQADLMAEETGRLLEADDGKRRVRIAERDGLFVIIEEVYFQNIYEGQIVAEGWRALPRDASYFADAEIAESEARTLYKWLSG